MELHSGNTLPDSAANLTDCGVRTWKVLSFSIRPQQTKYLQQQQQ